MAAAPRALAPTGRAWTEPRGLPIRASSSFARPRAGLEPPGSPPPSSAYNPPVLLSLGILALAWAPTGPLRAQSPVGPEHATPGGKPGSLEAFLRKVRAEREVEFGRLRGRVESIVGKLSVVKTPEEGKTIQAEIDALGPEAAPLFLPHLDPGANPGPGRERQCEAVAAALGRLKNPAILEALLELARSASPRGRALAVRVLGSSSDEVRAREALRGLLPGVQGALRAECVRSLARLDPADPMVVAALADPEPEVVRAGLEALAGIPRKEPLPAVLELAHDPARAAPVLPTLVAYLRVPNQELDEETVVGLLRLACRTDLPPESRLAVLEGLPHFGLSLGTKLRREIEPLLESSDSALREGALVALALLHDSRAKRDLLRTYDEQVEDNVVWPLAYQRRGDILLRIGEYAAAVKDYRTAIELHGQSARLPGNRELWVDLARASIKDDKLRSAAETLEKFGLTSDLKRELAADPDFAPLREHPRYKKLFD